MKLIILKYLLFALGLLFVWKYNTQKNQIQAELDKKRQTDSLVQVEKEWRIKDSIGKIPLDSIKNISPSLKAE